MHAKPFPFPYLAGHIILQLRRFYLRKRRRVPMARRGYLVTDEKTFAQHRRTKLVHAGQGHISNCINGSSTLSTIQIVPSLVLFATMAGSNASSPRATNTLPTVSRITMAYSPSFETDVHTITDASKNNLDTLEALFAGLSVLIGALALVVGLFQMFRRRRRHATSTTVDAFELEADMSEVWTNLRRQCSSPNVDAGLGRHAI